MKIKHLFSALFMGAVLVANADGYKDGIEYYKAGQYDNALDILNRNINASGTDKALSYYYMGQASLAKGDKTAAKSYFDKGMAADALNPYNYVGLGAISLLEGNVKAAEDQFKEAQKLGKKNNEITVDIARAYYNANPVTYAKEIEKLLAKAHKDSKDKEPAIYILEGDMLFDSKDLGGAAARYEQAITFDVNNPEGYVKYANAYMGVNPIYGVQKLEELLAKQPTSALAQRELAEKYYETDQWTKAANQYGNYIQNPNHFPEDKSRYSVLLYANQEYQKSLDIANELLAVTPNDFQMQRIRMLDLKELAQNQAAIDAAQKFFNLPEEGKAKFQPNDYLTYAAALEAIGNDSVALIQYEKAVAVDPTRADNIKALSAAYLKAQKFQESAETFDQYIAAQGDDATLTDYLQSSGRWLNAAGHATDSIQAMDAAAKGLVSINKVIEGATVPQADYYARQGMLNYKKAGDQFTDDVFNSYMKVVELLDATPEAKDPTNPANKLQLYSQAYLFLGGYYGDKGEKEKRQEMYDKQDEVKALLGQ